MKNIITGIGVALLIGSCNAPNDKKPESNSVVTDTTRKQTYTNNTEAKEISSIQEILNGYLKLKNALADDNANGAADGGKAILKAATKFNSSSLSPGQRKIYDDIAEDVKDNAQHISENSDKIAHQRQHLEALSVDMYDLIKTFGGDEIYYNDYCPMYNNGKGATWISETKDIKNPYLGKKMPACGAVKEEIK
ncbi:MAG: DUF3347 domain-containing protein [Ferruginibacter sp.]